MAGAGKVFTCGDYGLIVTGLGPTTDLLAPIKSSARIKYTCVAVSSKYIVCGASTGGLYVFDKNTFKYLKLIGNKEGPVRVLSFSTNSVSIVGAGTSLGNVLVWDIGASSRDRPKCIKRSDEHKGSAVTSLCWDERGSRMFAGDTKGNIGVTHITTNPLNKGFSFPHLNEAIHKCESQIVQLDFAADRLLISTLRGCTLYDFTRSQAVSVGSKPRDGLFGASFFRQEQWNYPAIYAARPGSRLWEVSFDGQVLATQQYKKLLAIDPAVVLGYGHEMGAARSVTEVSPKAINFARLLIIRDRFLVTWHGSALYILDPIVGRVVCWLDVKRDIADVCCHGNQLYAYHADGQVTWYGLLSVKECVSSLFIMNELAQCAKVCVECREDIITGTARDLVPNSLLLKLKDHFQGREESELQALASCLGELEQQLEESYVMSEFDVPRLFGGGTAEAASVMSGDLGPIAVGSESGMDDDDNLSVSQADDDQKPQNQPRDLSLEHMLMSAAVLAKRLKSRGGKSPLRRAWSSDVGSAGHGQNRPDLTRLLSAAESESKTSVQENPVESESEALPSFDLADEKVGPALEEGVAPKHVSHVSSGLAAEHSVCHSDDSDTKPSGLEETPVLEKGVMSEQIIKRERSNTKEKKKKKRKVVTVDIDTPKSKLSEGKALVSERSLSAGYGKTYSSFGNTEVQTRSPERGQSDPGLSLGGTSEYSPAIPVMLSTAKGLLLRRRTTVDGELSPVETPIQSPVLSGDEGTAEEPVDEPAVIRCPTEVKELVHLSKKTRDKVKSPKVLYYPEQLSETLNEWIPHMDKAIFVCENLGFSQGKEINLKTFLEEDDCSVFTSLLHMCLDTGIYGQAAMAARDSTIVSPDQSKNKIVSGETKFGIREDSDSVAVSHSLSEDQQDISHEVSDRSDHAHKTGQDGQMGVAQTSSWDAVEDSDKVNRNLCDKVIVQEEINCACLENREKIDGRSSCDSKAEMACTSEPDTWTESSQQLNLLSDVHSRVPWRCSWCVMPPLEEISRMCWQGLKLNTSKIKEQIRADCERAQFVERFFSLLDLKKLRRTLRLLRGYKHNTWQTITSCLQGVCASDTVSGHTREGDARRALHVLHDGIEEYCNAVVYHLPRCYELDGKETVLTCARLFPDVQPWEVAEMCMEGMSRDQTTNAGHFVYYVDQLIRWRAEAGIDRERTISTLCQDENTLLWWIHSALLADKPSDSCHCLCRLPRAGSHHVAWQHNDHLERALDYVSQRSQVWLSEVIHLCWQHGYWPGFLNLCTFAGFRKDALQVICHLGDIQLLKSQQPWGLLPKSLEDWQFLLRFVAEETNHKCDCTPYSKVSGWLPDVSLQHVLEVALDRLGAGHTIRLLKGVPYLEGSLTKEFYYKCIVGAMVEKKQRDTTEELLKKLDSYLWSQRPGVVVPSLGRYKDEEQLQTSRDEVCSEIQYVNPSEAKGKFFPFVRTLEDAATHWGSNIRLADADCRVCGLPLREQVSTSTQGLLVFECGHVFHKHCIPEHACVVCFHQNLTTIASTAQRT